MATGRDGKSQNVQVIVGVGDGRGLANRASCLGGQPDLTIPRFKKS